MPPLKWDELLIPWVNIPDETIDTSTQEEADIATWEQQNVADTSMENLADTSQEQSWDTTTQQAPWGVLVGSQWEEQQKIWEQRTKWEAEDAAWKLWNDELDRLQREKERIFSDPNSSVDDRQRILGEIEKHRWTSPKITYPWFETDQVQVPDVNVEDVKTTETTPTEVVKSETEITAEQKWYTYEKSSTGQITFQPQSLDEALNLFQDFWDWVNLDTSSKFYWTAKRIKDTYSKYKNAPESVYLQWFKSWEIGTEWPTWDYLVKANWGQPTAAMLAAQKQFDDGLKLETVKQTSNIINWQSNPSYTETKKTSIEQLDESYINSVNKLFWDIRNEWNRYKWGNEELNTLNEQLNDLASEMDELEVEKRKVLKQVQEEFPQATLWQQLVIADERLEAIDDQMFVKQRSYKAVESTYNFKNEQAKWDFEFNQSLINSKLELIQTMYWTKRWDLIRQEEYARADDLLQKQWDKADADYQRALADGRIDRAKDIAYQKEILKYQQELQDSNKANFQALTPGNWMLAVFDPNTWEIEWKEVKAWTATGWWITWSGKITQIDFTTPTWTKKVLKIDETAKSDLESAIKQFQIEVPGWDKIIIGDSFRTTEEQQKLYDAYKAWTGWLAAKPGTSAHEKGLAIDIYANSNYDPLTTEQVAVMNANWWYQTAWEEDLWHFEYLGKTTTLLDSETKPTDVIIDESLLNAIMSDNSYTMLKSAYWTDKADEIISSPEFIQYKELFKQNLDKNRDLQNLRNNLFNASRISESEQQIVIWDSNRAIFDDDREWIINAIRKMTFKGQTEEDQPNLLMSTIQWAKKLNRIDELLSDKDIITWIIEGNLEKAAQKLWTTSSSLIKEIDLLSNFLASDYIRSVSWAWVTDTERDYFNNLFTNIKNDKEVNTVIIDTYRDILKDNMYWIQQQVWDKALYEEVFAPEIKILEWSSDYISDYINNLWWDTTEPSWVVGTYLDSVLNPNP